MPREKRKPWTAEEDERLARLYAERGYAAATTGFKGRTYRSVKWRIHFLGLGPGRTRGPRADTGLNAPRLDDNPLIDAMRRMDELTRQRRAAEARELLAEFRRPEACA